MCRKEKTTHSELDISDKKRGKEIIEYVSAGMSITTGGLSEALMFPIRRVVERRLQKLEEVLVEELRAGLVTEDAVIEEDRLAAFILRVRRASMEGAARNRLKIMARYFFRNAPSPDFAESIATDFYSVTEQLTDSDMRCLALLKRARINGYFDKEDNERRTRRIEYKMDTTGMFSNEIAFDQAALALVRFGFIGLGSTWGGIGMSATDRCLTYIDNLDLENIEGSEE